MFAATTIYEQVRQACSWTDMAVYAVILFITWQIYRNIVHLFFSPLMKIPGLPYRPVLGNMLEVSQAEPMTNAIRWINQYKSKLIRYWYYGGELKLVTGDPEVFRHILVNNSRNYERVTDIFGPFLEFVKYPPLFMLSGDEHHMVRRISNPAFRAQVLNYMSEIFSKKSVIAVKTWRELIKKGHEILPVEGTIEHLTMEVIMSVAFDCDMDVISNPKTSGMEQIHRIAKRMAKTGSIMSKLIPFYKHLPTKDKLQFEQDLVFVWKMMDDIQTKKQQSGYQMNRKQWQDILTNLMVARDADGQSALTNKQLFGQVMGFFLAGYDTTSAGMTWTLLHLAQDAERQQKVREEVQAVLSSNDDPITVEDIDKMPYLTLCINEGLRICPPVTSMNRKAIHDDTLLGYHIPAGTAITLHIAALHWVNWDEPDKFLPERFLNISETEIRKKFMPFSYGPYMCIGHQFAMMQMKIVLSRLLKEFRFSWVPDYTFKRMRGVAMRPNPPLVLKVERIQKK